MKEQTFLITVVPISKWITTENMLSKLSLLFGGIGIKVNSIKPVEDDQGDEVGGSQISGD
jgi:hypothetical protein